MMSMALPAVYEDRSWPLSLAGAAAGQAPGSPSPLRRVHHLNPASSSFTPSSPSHPAPNTTNVLGGFGHSPDPVSSSLNDLAAIFGKLHIKDNSGNNNGSNNDDGSPRKQLESTPESHKTMPADIKTGHLADDVEATRAQDGAGSDVDARLGVQIRHNNPPVAPDVFGAIVKSQVARHLQGRFDFMLTMPEVDADADAAEDGTGTHTRAKLGSSLAACSKTDAGTAPTSTMTSTAAAKAGRLRYFGCNVVARRRRSLCASAKRCPKLGADIVTVVATPLPDHPQLKMAQEAECAQSVGKRRGMNTCSGTQEEITRHNPSLLAAPTPIIVSESHKAEAAIVQTIVEVPNKMERGALSPVTPIRSCSQLPSHGPPVSPSVRSDDGASFGGSSRLSLSPLRHNAGHIEDSFEELDMLEEELEAIKVLTRVDRIKLPERSPSHVPLPESPTSVRASPARRPLRVRPQSLIAASKLPPVSAATKKAHRQSIAVSSLLRYQGYDEPDTDVEAEEAMTPAAESPTSPVRKDRLVVARPASLLPPKPLIRSTKAPTVPSFELPGKAVARRLKEQREARLAQQATSPERAGPARIQARLSRTPTQANSELPGEALARRKREEREAQLRQQEEEERRKREIRARRARAAAATAQCATAKPRDTITSRARQAKAMVTASEENVTIRTKVNSSSGSGSLALGAGKRASTIGAPPRPRQALTATAVANVPSQSYRGRESLVAAIKGPAVRASSTSTAGASSSSSRSGVSVEEMHAQRMRGKEIVDRERIYIDELEQAQRAKELMAKKAREEAAERSRRLSRQWAEKHQRNQATAATFKALSAL